VQPGGPPPSPEGQWETLEGKIAEVIYLPGATPEAALVEVRLQHGKQTIVARLAPTDFLKRSEVALKEGDSLSLTGYRVAGFEGELLVVTEVRKGSRSVILRDQRGRPLW
jgi:hypothetical protein